MSISIGSVHTILHERLGYLKVCAQWVPKHLTEEQKINRMSVSMKHLMRYHKMRNQFLSRIIAADEAWFHQFDPATKSMGMEWRHSSSSHPKKARTSTTVGKAMLMCLFEVDGPLLLEWLPTGTTVTAATYYATLQELIQNIKKPPS
ncbi:histone-lysine N-methyltransferase SETMAR-like [Stegodyphus dumicola]|uniref:histone-lysine N-methyltransferase SETMAR-like n=1 Tax=Stegodyphus dumicola TaxID=202533 RepID=UPI0015A7CB71|nr:histone-lysine N-methyltransferase SETMAR-like [Stegodyphus dumicola]